MTRIIAVIGGKGGVGKTTITSNLAYALTELGENVIVIDTNLTTPNLGLHVGMHSTANTLHDVISGRASLKDAIYPHPFGFKFIPASMAVDDLIGADPSKISEITFNLIGKADYILMDCAAGLGREAVSAIDAADEILIVTNADLPAVVDALKVVEIAKRLNKKIVGVIINRRRWKWYELSREKIQDMLELPVILEIPEDNVVSESISARQPVMDYAPQSDVAFKIREMAHILTGKRFEYKKSMRTHLLDKLIGWIKQ